ncbi:MAG: hypothetical protein RLZZ227_516 [Pseudomonadota bacterium]|jgi:uncharacterized protein YqgV (UPF0045/DUF77 family)
MMLTVEISMYPFQQDYAPPILAFIKQLNTQAGLRVQTTATATLIVGEYGLVMRVLTEMLKWSHETLGKAVFVTKLIPGYAPE